MFFTTGFLRDARRILLKNVASIPDQLNRISVNIRYTNAWEEITTFPARKPRTFNVLLATTKTWLADLLVQLAQAKGRAGAGADGGGAAPRVDWRRSAAFAAFGCFYVGLAQWFFLVSLFSLLCPRAVIFANESAAEKWLDRPGQLDLVRQVCYDNFVLEVFIYFPVFYVIKESIVAATTSSAAEGPASAGASSSASGVGAYGSCGGGGEAGQELASIMSSPAETSAAAPPQASLPLPQASVATRMGQAAQAALRRYRTNFWADNLASCLVWVPGDLLIYAAPMYLRMPMDHLLSFLWTMVLSFMRGGAGAKQEGAK